MAPSITVDRNGAFLGLGCIVCPMFQVLFCCVMDVPSESPSRIYVSAIGHGSRVGHDGTRPVGPGCGEKTLTAAKDKRKEELSSRSRSLISMRMCAPSAATFSLKRSLET
jgi:hypothetical protein